MLFNSFEFIAFYVVFVIAFFSIDFRWRYLLTLISSYIFYMAWKPEYGLLMLACSCVNYAAALAIDACRSSGLQRRAILSLTITLTLGSLFYYKYADFALSTINGLFSVFHLPTQLPLLHVILPVGISFFSFQALSYTIDVYRGDLKPEKSLAHFLLFVSFFPQLVAGPIERATHLLPQMHHQTRVEYWRISQGFLMFLWGMFKKVCVADLVSPFVDGVYSQPEQYNGTYLMLGTVLFAIQIYCDFSGYSDMAVGIARILGYDLMINFAQPYFSVSLSEFWRRWHISLSTWFRDYVYFPMGGNRVPTLRWMWNIFIVFVISGVWHGANWTYVLWGAVHGAALILEVLIIRTIGSPTGKLARMGTRYGGWLLTIATVLLSWVFFRAESIGEALTIIRRMASPGPLQYGTFKNLGLPSFEIPLLLHQLLILFCVDWCLSSKNPLVLRLWCFRVIRWGAGIYLFYNIAFFGVFGKKEFIYFQF